MKPFKCLFFIPLFLEPFLLLAQNFTQNCEGKIVNALDGEPIAYVHVYVKGCIKGTVSNLEGEFFLQNIKGTDTLVFSFIGFDRWEALAQNVSELEVIKLYPSTEVLTEVTLVNNDQLLYELLANCKKRQARKVKTAKTYFSLNTFVDSSQVELIECYYNGDFRGYDLDNLKLKNGRISLKPFDTDYFVSVSASRALIEHHLFEKSKYFPRSPFELSKKTLQKEFFVQRESKYRDEEGRVVYAIKYTPKKETALLFYGKAWIDSTSGHLLKVELNSDSTLVSPFIPLFPVDSLKKTAFKISKTFEMQGDKMYVKSIDFKYELVYDSQRHGEYTVQSNAVLYAYSYQDEFLLPFYNAQLRALSDYRKITSAPYNTFFWENIQEFQMDDVVAKNERFANQSVLINDVFNSSQNMYLRKGFFERNYVLWSPHRMHLIDRLPQGTLYEDLDGMLPSRRYFLQAHLYLDVNTFKDSTHYLLKAVYDPFWSYFHYPDSKRGDAFINMYFDLFEMEKRQLEMDLVNFDTTDAVLLRLKFEASLEKLGRQSRKYIKEVERGKDKQAFERWNALIKKGLDIDNIEFYNLGDAE